MQTVRVAQREWEPKFSKKECSKSFKTMSAFNALPTLFLSLYNSIALILSQHSATIQTYFLLVYISSSRKSGSWLTKIFNAFATVDYGIFHWWGPPLSAVDILKRINKNRNVIPRKHIHLIGATNSRHNRCCIAGFLFTDR